MTEGGPGLAVLLVDVDQFDVVFNGSLVITLGSTVLSQLVDFVHVNDVVAHEWCVEVLLASSLSRRGNLTKTLLNGRSSGDRSLLGGTGLDWGKWCVAQWSVRFQRHFLLLDELLLLLHGELLLLLGLSWWLWFGLFFWRDVVGVLVKLIEFLH